MRPIPGCRTTYRIKTAGTGSGTTVKKGDLGLTRVAPCPRDSERQHAFDELPTLGTCTVTKLALHLTSASVTVHAAGTCFFKKEPGRQFWSPSVWNLAPGRALFPPQCVDASKELFSDAGARRMRGNHPSSLRQEVATLSGAGIMACLEWRFVAVAA